MAIPPNLANLIGQQSPPKPAPSAEGLGDQIMNMAYQMREREIHFQTPGDKFSPLVTAQDPNCGLLKAFSDTSVPSLPVPVSGTTEAANRITGQWQTLVDETVKSLTQGMPYELVERKWQTKIDQLKSLAADQYNAQIDEKPADRDKLATERDKAISALDGLRSTDNGSAFYGELQRINAAMEKQNEINKNMVLERTATPGVVNFVRVLNLDERAKKDKEDAEKAEQPGFTIGVQNPKTRETGVYKLAGEQDDNKKSGIYFVFDKGPPSKATASPFPNPMHAGALFGIGPNFKKAWTKTFQMLAQEGDTIVLSGTIGKNIAVMADILLKNHKDRYIELGNDAMTALMNHTGGLSVAEANRVIKAIEKHNDDLDKKNQASMSVVVEEIKAKVQAKREDLTELTKDVHIVKTDRVDSMLKEMTATTTTQERKLELAARLASEIAVQSRELESVSPQDLVGNLAIQGRIDKIIEAQKEIVILVTLANQKLTPPPAAGAPGAAAPPDQNAKQRTEFGSILQKADDVKTKVEAVKQRKQEAENTPRPSI